ncbi:SulP family inorganic anion transporter [Candidatus Woesearchaeota archaeon]|nr:SulP family inorganic anion transporter [Candidatus Woesearchaeota archaeon]
MNLSNLISNVNDYFKQSFLSDLKAGFITAIVALPLAIAFAIASGVPAIMGLYTAIVAGILGSLFGGSIYSITGPTGAMTVIILSAVSRYGIEGLLLAGFLAGIFQIIFGLIKLGQFVKYIPLPVISGFTAGIGAIIFIGQIGNALGFSIVSKEHVWETILEIIRSLSSINIVAIFITIFTACCLLFLPRLLSRFKYLHNVPSSIIPLILSTAAVMILRLSIPQVGNIPPGLPQISLPAFSFDLLERVLPSAFTIALLGTIESLLCAVVCDGMTNTKHNSNKELISQGIANIVLPFFGAIPSTAAIARSAVNIREGAKTRWAGVIHALILLLILLFFSSIAQYIPKAFLAGVLMVVAARMINVHEFRTIMKISRSETIVLLATFGFTVFTDLVIAVEIGMVFSIFLLFIKLTSMMNITSMKDYEANEGINNIVNNNPKLKDIVAVYTIYGPFFFGAMNIFDKKLTEHMDVKKPVIILRMRYVPFIDSTAIVRLNDFIKERKKSNSTVLISSMNKVVQKTLLKNKEFTHLVKERYRFNKTQDALEYVEKSLHNILLNGK